MLLQNNRLTSTDRVSSTHFGRDNISYREDAEDLYCPKESPLCR